MALGKVDKAVESARARGRTVAAADSRYATCSIVTESGVARLAFRRYSNYDASSTPTSRVGFVTPGSEARFDCMAQDAYGTPRLMWAVFMFNRGHVEDLSPLRFDSGARLALPTLAYVLRRLRGDVVVDV